MAGSSSNIQRTEKVVNAMVKDLRIFFSIFGLNRYLLRNALCAMK